MRTRLAETVSAFHLPKYAELPNMGLYLEQVTTYLNQLFAPLGCVELTGSMIRNYVKKGLIANPVQKRYYADHIAHLIAVALLKNVLSLENIQTLFVRQQQIYTVQIAYDYLCLELENMLFFMFEVKDTVDEIGSSSSTEKQMLRSAIIALCNIIYLNACFRQLPDPDTKTG